MLSFIVAACLMLTAFTAGLHIGAYVERRLK